MNYLEILKKKIKNKSLKVGVIGLGYVGLPLLIQCVKKNFFVYGFDNDSKKINMLVNGKSYIKHIDQKEIKKIKSPTKISKQPSYIQSVYKVLFADITISFDNVIGVVGAARGNFGFMVFGLVLSVILTGALATYLANYIQKHLWIAYIGLAFILIVAIQLIIGGLVDLEILKVAEDFKKYF